MKGPSTNQPTGQGNGDVEPRLEAGSSPHVFWLMSLFGILVVWGDSYLINRAADFHPQVYTPYTSYAEVDNLRPKSADDMLAVKGRMLYGTFCQPCHQPNAAGVPGQFPPLAGSDWVSTPGANRLIRIVLNGLAGPVTVNGLPYNNAMPGFKDSVSDEDVAAVLSFVRGNKEWGNSLPGVKPEEVKAIRAMVADRADQWTSDELLKVPDSN